MQEQLQDEGFRAREWRQRIGLSVRQLATRTGFAESSIYDIEAGKHRMTGYPISRTVMRRYRLACAAIDAGLSNFDWRANFKRRRRR